MLCWWFLTNSDFSFAINKILSKFAERTGLDAVQPVFFYMVQAYNFLASWQLFPEKGIYEFGDRPRSGIYKMESVENERLLSVSMNWVTLENQAFGSTYLVMPDGKIHPFENP